MVRETIYEPTSVRMEDTTCTYSASPTDPTTTVDYGYTITYVDSTDYYFERVKELLRKEIILKMKDTWVRTQKEFRSVPPIRPAAQLRGVCLNGRGWA